MVLSRTGDFRKPWPEDLVWAVAGLAFELGWWGVGIGIILWFYELLRPGEISNLRREDVRTPFDLVASSLDVLIVVINNPKTRRRAARTQHVAIKKRIVLTIFAAFLPFFAPTEFLFPSYDQMRRFATLLLNRLGLGSMHYTLGGLRGGGGQQIYIWLSKMCRS